jgi:acyl carrier protein
MDRDTISSRLTPIFRRVFADNTLALTDALTAADVNGWDSLSHINLILAVEREFGVRLTTREVRSMKSVGDLITLVERKAA